MGAGAVKQADANCQPSTSSLPQSLNPQRPNPTSSPTVCVNINNIMSCENCTASFSVFKRKKPCYDCNRNFCPNCLIKINTSNGTKRRCGNCKMLTSGNFTKKDLSHLKTKELQMFLTRKNIPTQDCTEKGDLIDLLMQLSQNHEFHQERQQLERRRHELEERRRQVEETFPTSAPQQSASQEDLSSTSSTSSTPQHTPPPQPSRTSPEEVHTGPVEAAQATSAATTSTTTTTSTATESEGKPASQVAQVPRYATLAQIHTQADIEDLTVRQLKEILTTNYVDYKGCCERWELRERVLRLWGEHSKNQAKVEVMEDPDGEAGVTEGDMCKVCMDAIIDCVLLECGHMVTCTKCGKQMAECPVCRQYVSRVVHTFKA